MSTEGKASMNPVPHDDVDISPELAPLNLADKPDGPGAAMMISAGIGLFVLGFFTILSDASPGAKAWLHTFQGSVGRGPLPAQPLLAPLAHFGSPVLL